jgi:hypothetical protein
MKSYLFPILALAMIACQKEAKLTPGEYESPYKLPQGNTVADDTIMSIYKKFGTYILYRFSQADYAYDYSRVRKDSAFNANPAYIDTALNFFTHQLMRHYPDSFLRKTMPLKVLLASRVTAKNAFGNAPIGFASTASMFAIGWADSTLVHLTPPETKKLRGQLHHYYWERAYRTKSVEIPPAFAQLIPGDYAKVNFQTRYQLGVVADLALPELNIGQDFLAYIDMITCNTTAELEAGYFTPNIDTKGLIRQKYNVIITYYKTEYGIDLQAIGNLP